MFSQACIPHFDKLSVGFKHLECNLHVGSIWHFNKKKIREASGMVFRFHSLQVTFFCFSQSDFFKKKNFHVKEKKLVVKLNSQPLVKHSRPDLSNGTWELSKVMDKAMEGHMKELCRVIKYSLDTQNIRLKLKPEDNDNKLWELKAYSDADFAGDKEHASV